MKKLFLESKEFTRWLHEHLDDVSFAAFQFHLMSNPDLGAVIPGCGGLRKVRLAEAKRRRGKRGGSRVIYLHIPEANWIFLLAGYSKGEKDDLSVAQKRTLRRLAAVLKREALASVSGR